MGIPVGKLSLYAVLGGIDPARTLPVLLDVGTGNAGLLDDPVYLGWRHRRIAGAAYDDFVDRFVQAVRAELPGVLLQWEDFATPRALPVRERCRAQVLSFNDDIQGTAAVVLAALSAGGSSHRVPAARPDGGDARCRAGWHRSLRAGRAADGGRRPVRAGCPRQDLRGRRRRPAHHRPPGPQPGAAPARPAAGRSAGSPGRRAPCPAPVLAGQPASPT